MICVACCVLRVACCVLRQTVGGVGKSFHDQLLLFMTRNGFEFLEFP